MSILMFWLRNTMSLKFMEKSEMIAYKFFDVNNGDFYPGVMNACFEPYPVDCIVLRADSCGPFACFGNIQDAKRFQKDYAWWGSDLYKVKIKKSRAKTLWFTDRKGEVSTMEENWFPKGIILADEFEILEEIK